MNGVLWHSIFLTRPSASASLVFLQAFISGTANDLPQKWNHLGMGKSNLKMVLSAMG